MNPTPLLLQEEAASWSQQFKAAPPPAAIVFILGGSTYEEAKAVAEWNARQGPGGMRVLLGGSAILNSDAFLAALGAGSGSALGSGGGGEVALTVR